MSRGVLIGDVHSKVEDLDDCEALAEVVLEVCRLEKPDWVAFLGDLYDAFAVKNVVVERWWQDFLRRIPLPPEQKYILVGNHDRPGDSTQAAHSLQAHYHDATVVESYRPIREGIAALPFHFKAEDFVAAATEETVAKAQTLLCHQSFIGGKYESGQDIDAKHDASAVDPAVLPQKCVIGGHIHTPQHLGKVWYPGAPRWRNNVSDANLDRFVYVIDFKSGLPAAIRKYPTGEKCRRIWQVDVTPDGTTVPYERGKPGDRWVVDISGPAAFIEQASKDWSAPGIRVRKFQTDRPGPKLSEAKGVGAAWSQWETEYKPKHGTSVEVLATMARERLAL